MSWIPLNDYADIEDLVDVLEAMEDVSVKYKRIGASLRIKNGELQIIEKQNRHDPKAGLSAVLENWLNLNFLAKKGESQQPPSWRKVVEVVAKSVAGGNHALAKKIASEHPCIGDHCFINIPGICYVLYLRCMAKHVWY